MSNNCTYKVWDSRTNLYVGDIFSNWDEVKEYVENNYVKQVYYTRVWEKDAFIDIIDFGSYRYFVHREYKEERIEK